MKDDSKKIGASPFSNNPFLSKPLKKINNSNISSSPQVEKPKENKINEHRASKFINIQNNIKNNNNNNYPKKPVEPQKVIKNKNQNDNNIYIVSQGENKYEKDKNKDGTNFKSILKKFNSQEKNKINEDKSETIKKQKKRASIEKYLNPKIEENFKKENELSSQKNYANNNSEPNEENKNENKIIQVSVKESLLKKVEKKNDENIIKKEENNNIFNDKNKIVKKEENTIKINNNGNNNDFNVKNNNIKKDEKLISFKNEDEILEYIKNKIKDGKIQNIYQKLELKNDDFTCFSLSKKNKGYTIYEIKIEDDIKKINEIFKAQKVEINKKPIQLIYTDELESLINIKKEYNCLKEVTFSNIKNDYEKSISLGKPKDNSTNKPLEVKNIKNDKNNNEINNNKNRTNNIQVEGNFKSKIRESEMKEKISIKKPEDENKCAQNAQTNDKKTKEIQNQKRMSKAYNRFKKAFSLHKDKENEKNIDNSKKILSMASMLQDHIIKPINEMQEENEGTGKIYRGGSVECRKSKMADDNLVKLLENIPVNKKQVKKPKINNFS